MNAQKKKCGWSMVGGAVCAMVLATSALAVNTREMVCIMRGAQETPPVATPGRGCGRFVLNDNTNTLSYRISFSNLVAAETAAHFHTGAPGVAGPVAIALPAGNPKVGVVVLTAAQKADFLNGNWYVNIHTVVNPGGEIRGQINTFAVELDGAQETPSNATGSRGWATMNYDQCTNALRYYIVVESLSAAETAAHIHGLANYGTAAGVLVPLPAGTPKVGATVMTEAFEQPLINGMMYVNVHSVAFPGGEIRGQIISSVNPMDGLQETPPIAGLPSAGCTLCAFNQPANTLGYHVIFGGNVTAETAAHIHGFAPPGVAAGVLNPLALGNPKYGTWVYGAANAAAVLDGRTYTNIHTVANPGGEIRGQLFPIKPRCAGDANCDGKTDIDDLVVAITAWGPCPAPPALCPGDLNYTGNVDIDDLVLVITSWGKCP